MFTNKHRGLWNSPSWPQFKITSASQGRIPLSVHYFFCTFTNRVKSLQKELKYAVFHLLTEYFITGIYLLLDLITRAEAVTPVSA